MGYLIGLETKAEHSLSAYTLDHILLFAAPSILSISIKKDQMAMNKHYSC